MNQQKKKKKEGVIFFFIKQTIKISVLRQENSEVTFLQKVYSLSRLQRQSA